LYFQFEHIASEEDAQLHYSQPCDCSLLPWHELEIVHTTVMSGSCRTVSSAAKQAGSLDKVTYTIQSLFTIVWVSQKTVKPGEAMFWWASQIYLGFSLGSHSCMCSFSRTFD
jgi:hypothetical protein